MKSIIITILLFSSFVAFGQNKKFKEKTIKLKIDFNSDSTVRRFNHKDCKDSIYFIREKDSMLVNGQYKYGVRTRVMTKKEVRQRNLK